MVSGAVGIGLARLGMTKRAAAEPDTVLADIDDALDGATRGWPGHVDTLCCGTLGSVELCREAGRVLNRTELVERASRRLLAVLEPRRDRGLPMERRRQEIQRGSVPWSGGRRLHVPSGDRRLDTQRAHLGVVPSLCVG